MLLSSSLSLYAITGALIVLDVILGIASALRTRQFSWVFVADFIGHDLQHLVVIATGAWIANQNGIDPTAITAGITLVCLALISSLVASIAANLTDLFGVGPWAAILMLFVRKADPHALSSAPASAPVADPVPGTGSVANQPIPAPVAALPGTGSGGRITGVTVPAATQSAVSGQ